MSLLEILKDHPEILSRASKEMSDMQESGVAGRWSIEFHHKPGGLLETIKVTGRSMEFRVRPYSRLR